MTLPWNPVPISGPPEPAPAAPVVVEHPAVGIGPPAAPEAPAASQAGAQRPTIDQQTERVVVEGEKAVDALAAAGVINQKQGTAMRSTLAAVAACVALVIGVYSVTFGKSQQCEVDLQPGTAVVVTPTSAP